MSSHKKIKVDVRRLERSPSNSDEDLESESHLPSSMSQSSNRRKLTSFHTVRSKVLSPIQSSTDTSTSMSNPSVTGSIDRFRYDFDEIKCKVRIFGESLNLCRCIAFDFKNKMNRMEKRLRGLENRQTLTKTESNYTSIIKKNKQLSNKTQNDAKKLQMCGTEAEMREVAGRICKNYLHGAWKAIEPADLDFRKINGGLSNFLYYVALPDDPMKLRYVRRESMQDSDDYGGLSYDEPKQVLLRIYGQVHGERAMDAIVTESVIFTLLSERRLGPKLHGVFSGGRIEEYIPARCLLVREMAEPAMSMKIAEKMAAIHSMDVPLSKEPNWIWKTMHKWLKTVKEERLAETNKGKNEEEQSIIRRLKVVDFDKEIDWLRKYLSKVESPVVFCHNDMQEGNILLLRDEPQHDEYANTYVQTYSQQSIHSPGKETSLEDIGTMPMPISEKILAQGSGNISRATYMESDTGFEDANTLDSNISDSGEPQIVLIDFEYCAYNYRGFDIANHFQEWGFDYTNPNHPFYYEIQENSPTLEQKEIFIKEYLKHYHNNVSDEKDPTLPTIEAVNHLLGEVDAFALASHLFWCLWAVVNAGKSQIPFGYWEYALSRLEAFMQLKQETIKGDSSNRPQKRKIQEVDI